MMTSPSSSLQTAVQQNCHIADARHAGDYTLCIYLLKMREFYRWEQGYAFRDALPSDAVGDWLRSREDLWEGIQDNGYEPLPVLGRQLDPFHTSEINARLLPQGLVYSGGLGHAGRPHFFLAELGQQQQHADYQILVSGREYARDLTAPPAMSLGKTIFIRRESLRRMIWEKIEEARWNRREGPMSRAMAGYDFDQDLDGALEQMTDHEVESVLLHEIGEIMAGERLGSGWEAMLAELPRSRLEIMARAIRDHLADCLSTLPGLLQSADDARLHFYFANLGAMRKTLAPGLQAAYQAWLQDGSRRALENQVRLGEQHWLELALELQSRYQAEGSAAIPQLITLIENRYL